MLASRAFLLILDGLRPDAIRPGTMPALHALEARAWRAAGAVTVRPSVTVAALCSLASGVSPMRHGQVVPTIRTLPSLRGLRPLPAELRRGGLPTAVVTGNLAPASLLVARGLLALAGIGRMRAEGRTPAATAGAALGEWRRQRRGLTVLYLNHCDLAGHAHGWMSDAYLEAAAALDGAVARLADPLEDGGTLMAVVADHGGGGVDARDHDAPHPINDAIPLLLAGPAVVTRLHHAPASLLDLPPTILHALGRPVPHEYEGRVLLEAFAAPRAAA